jgi:glutamate dehydrogenase
MLKSYITKALSALPANAPEAQKSLLKALAARIPQEDLENYDPELFAEMVDSQWALAKSRKSADHKIRIVSTLLKGHSYRKTVIDFVNDDMAFLVDSIAAEINKKNLLIELLLHPIVYVKYDKSGKLVDASDTPKTDYIRQSHIHVHIKDTLSNEQLAQLEEGLRTALTDVAIANRDWKPMLERLKEARHDLAGAKTKHAPKDIERYCAFLDYLHDNNFTLLGYREYEFSGTGDSIKSKIVKGESLGLLDDDITPAFINESEEGLPRNLQQLRRDLPPVSISKTNRLSTVHRRVPMDAIAVKTYDAKGNVKGEKLFLGLFTSVTYSRSVSDVPYLREKIDEIMEISDFLPGSHNRKALRHILEKYPRDEIFQISNEELYKIALEILRLQERQRIALFMRLDAFKRYVSCLVYVPRDRFGTSLRKAIGKILEQELHGQLSNFYTTLDDSVFARVMFIININQKDPPKFDAEKIEAKLQEAGRTLAERLRDALAEEIKDEDTVTSLTLKYGDAFPVAYTSRYRAKQAVFDVNKIEQCLKAGKLAVSLYHTDDLGENKLRLKTYNPGSPMPLSDVLPILENMGLRAISENPFEVKPQGAPHSVWIHDFLLEIPAETGKIDLGLVKDNFEFAFGKIWYGEIESDTLNKLVLSANLGSREISILRTYVRYMRQIRSPFGQPYIQTALTSYPKISALLVDLFKGLLDPKKAKGADPDALNAQILVKLENVESLDHDKILRTITALIDATLRTNYFQPYDNGEPKPYISLKFDSHKIPELPEPKPFREIFVYSPRVEGVHLRADKVSRGGIRWSDRHEDFRTEILGLLKAQNVKNAVIVPMGAKGGFVVKTPQPDRKAFQAEGIECYKTLVRGMLDITDNLKGEKVIHPKNVVRRDEDDPYLVVAADKGTASFSDIANGLSKEYDFWLGDAFASGGSAGYDHKKMGITARGAWECVKLNFRQLNHNIQAKPFEVIGVGDMGGDVFGNGMLLSEHIKLVGAFNHVHIFCDPTPDEASSFAERKRLFDGVMGWDQYDTKKLSKGGRIYNRSEKSLQLTPEIQKRFGISKEKVSPFELMNAMLKARCDLLWFGGIGTYVKGHNETHADVGDKANDAVRVDGRDLHAAVVGEGANLALTQRGRIEFAEKGGRLNTDFVDNSGGVNSSDVEVNIKILFTDIMSGKNGMDIAARNKLLEKMTAEVAEHVLRNNYQQSQAISLAELQAKETLGLQEEFIQELERTQGLNRALEGLPDSETVAQRLRLGKGMTRPELCVLLSYAKINFTKDLLDTDIPDSPEMEERLMVYFPKPLQEKFEKEILRHKLRREIIATGLANSLINRMGPTFIKSRMKKTGATAADIARAYVVVRESFGLRKIWSAIEGLDNKVPALVQLRAMREVTYTSEHAITWFITRSGHKFDRTALIRDYGAGIAQLTKNLPELVTKDVLSGITIREQTGVADGLPKDLARQIALMPILSSACDIIRISLEQKADLDTVARTYFEVGHHFHLDWMRLQARFMASDNAWHAEATAALVDQLFSSQAGLTVRMLKDIKAGGKNIAQEWFKKNADLVAQAEPVIAALQSAGTVDLPMLVLAEQRLRNLYGG